MTKKWNLLFARNSYILQTSAMHNFFKKGIKLDNLYWKQTRALAIIYNNSLMHIFSHKGKNTKTNFANFISKKNNEIYTLLSSIEKEINTDLKLSAGKSKNDILYLYKRFKINAAYMMMGYEFSDIAAKKLKKSVGIKKFKKFKNLIYSPCKKTLLLREHQQIESLKTKYHSKKTLDDKINDLVLKFGFIHSEYKGKDWAFKDYLYQIQQPKIKLPSIQTLKNEESFLINLSNYEKWLIEIIQKNVYIFDEGKSSLVRANWALRQTLKKMNIKEDIMNLTNKEFLQFLKTNNSINSLKKKREYYAIILDNNKLNEFLSKKNVERLIEKEHINNFQKYDNVDMLKGAVANSGKITRGKARIVYSQFDADQIKEKEILIASMTTPEHIKGLRKANAFITDEGGILCHAAIIAREMKKPCIIGTEIATKVINTGDLIEINPNKGTIKIIKKNK